MEVTIAEKSKDCPSAKPGTEIAIYKDGVFDRVKGSDEEPEVEAGENLTYVKYNASAFPLEFAFDRLLSSDNRIVDVNWIPRFRIGAVATFVGTTMVTTEHASADMLARLVAGEIRAATVFAVKKRSALDLHQRGTEESFANSFREDVRTAVGPALEKMGLEWVVEDTLPTFSGEDIKILFERERAAFLAELRQEFNNTKIQEIESEEQLRRKLHERDVNHLLRNEEIAEIVDSIGEKTHSKIYGYRKLTLTLEKRSELANERHHLLLEAERRNVNFEEEIARKSEELEKRFREIEERELQLLEKTRPEMLAQIERPRDIPVIIKTGSESVFPKRRSSDLLTDEYALDADSFVKGFILAKHIALRRNAAVDGSILGIEGVTMAEGCEVQGDVVSRVKIVVGPYCRVRNLIAPEIQFLGPVKIDGGMFCWHFLYEADDMQLPSVTKSIAINGMVISRSLVYVEGRHVVAVISEGNVNLREGSQVDYIRADGNLSIAHNCRFGIALVGGEVQVNDDSSGSVLYQTGEQGTKIGNNCTLQSVISLGKVNIGTDTRVDFVQSNGITLGSNCYVESGIDSYGEAEIAENCNLGSLSASGNIYLGNGVSINDWSIISYMGKIQFDEFPGLRDIQLQNPATFGITSAGQLSMEDDLGQIYTTLLNRRLFQTIRQTTGMEAIQIRPN